MYRLLRKVFPKKTRPTTYFLVRPGKNYRQVQKQLFSVIQKAMPKGSYTTIPEDEYKSEPNTISFDMFIRATGDVLMSHGVADKNYFFIRDEKGEYLVNRRKHLLVPGPWLKKKILNRKGITLKPNQIHCVGWPRLDYLLELQAEYNRENNHAEPKRKIKVLWAPTHDKRKRGPENQSTSSYPALEQWESLLQEKFDFTKALHPRNKVVDKKPTTESLIEADYVISDFGTIVYEAWALGKPVIFPTWLIGERIQRYLKGSAEAYIFKHKIGLHAESIDDVIRFIEEKQGLGEDVKEFMQMYLPDEYKGRSSKRIAQLLLELK